MELKEKRASFGGWQEVYQHDSATLHCKMNFAIYLPPQAEKQKLPVLYWLSGLSCTEQNFITKAGAQQYAAEHGIIIVAPDTSPRGETIADDANYDLGQGAGFYVNAQVEPWAAHYQMYDYIVSELPELIDASFPTNGNRAISGHSMGGHGALMIALRNPALYKSVSAFSPIVAPSQVPWGEKALTAYLGQDRSQWKLYDTVELINSGTSKLPLLVEQGLGDEFFEKQLCTHLLSEACDKAGHPVTVNLRAGYDHSYYFIASFIGEHIAYHAKALAN